MEVVGLTQYEGDKRSFKIYENNACVISSSQILQKLNFPQMVVTADRIKYIFNEDLIVDS